MPTKGAKSDALRRMRVAGLLAAVLAMEVAAGSAGATAVVQHQGAPKKQAAQLSFKDRVIAEWFDPVAIDRLRFGIELELHAPSLDRAALAKELVRIFKGKYDPEAEAIVGSNVGRLEFREEQHGHEFVTMPLRYDEIIEFARGLDELGKVPGIEGTDGKNQVGMHINVSIPEAPDDVRFVTQMALSTYGNYDAIVTDDPIPRIRKEFSQNVNHATFAYLASLWRSMRGVNLEQLRDVYRSIESTDYRAANLTPDHGRRIEFRYPNTKLGTWESPKQGSEHAIREVKFLGSLALSAFKGVVGPDGKLVEPDRLGKTFSRIPKWLTGKKAVKVSFVPPFGLMVNRGGGWKRAVDPETGSLSAWAIRSIHEFRRSRLISAEITDQVPTQTEARFGVHEPRKGQPGWNVLVDRTSGEIVRRSRGTFDYHDDAPGMLEKDGDRVTILSPSSGQVLIEDFVSETKLNSELRVLEGKSESVLVRGSWDAFRRRPGKYYQARLGGYIIHQQGNEETLLDSRGEHLLDGIVEEHSLGGDVFFVRGKDRSMVFLQKGVEVFGNTDSTFTIENGALKETRQGRSHIRNILRGDYWAELSEEVAALSAGEITRLAGPSGDLLAISHPGGESGALVSLAWAPDDSGRGIVLDRDFVSYRKDAVTGLIVGSSPDVRSGFFNSQGKRLANGVVKSDRSTFRLAPRVGARR